MRWGLVADIHANADALRHVLDALDQERVDRVIVLGDIVGVGPQPNETINLVRTRTHSFIIGDLDAAVLNKVDLSMYSPAVVRSLEWTRSVLTKESLEWLGKRSKAAHWNLYMFLHGTSLDPLQGLYTDDTIEVIRRKFAFRSVFSGHVHTPCVWTGDRFIETPSRIRTGIQDVICVGSVGWISEKGVSATAHYVVWDTKTGIVEFKQVSYNPATVLTRMHEEGLPPFEHSDHPNI